MFADRSDAGRQLAQALSKYRNQNPIVLGIPRGGIEVGYHIAQHLGCPLDMVICRKLPYDYNPEAGFGAIAEDGSTFMFEHARAEQDQPTIDRIIAEQQAELDKRVQLFRRGTPAPDLTGRTAILVDDGIAMGSTMRAAIMYCRHHHPAAIIVAAPVSGRDAPARFQSLADDVVILDTPASFYCVAQVYRNWYDVPYQEVIDLLDQWQREQRPTQA